MEKKLIKKSESKKVSKKDKTSNYEGELLVTIKRKEKRK